MENPFSFKHPTQLVSHVIGNVSGFLDGLYFCFYKDQLVTALYNDNVTLATSYSQLIKGRRIGFAMCVAYYNDTPCYVVELLDDLETSVDLSVMPLRAYFSVLDNDAFALAGRALQILTFHNDHNYCGQCGNRMDWGGSELAKKCSVCMFTVYPRISPVVIMTIERGGHILLGRGKHFPKGVYSPLAGFVEAGETLEDAVSREVFEEVGVSVDNITYITSQPWPFPHSLMTGFRTRYKEGDLKIDEHELEDAKWFNVDDLPNLPTTVSISRLLVEQFIKDCGTEKS